MKNPIREIIDIIETSEKYKDTLKQDNLCYDRSDLAPIMSKNTLDYHFGELAKKYVDRYNKGEGDAEFNKAGAVLHNIYFAQFKPAGGPNRPHGAIQEVITKHYKGNFENMKSAFEKEAMAIQGSGWVYLSRDGSIKTIKNHQIKNDIIILIDWWEHAWALDYQSKKEKYLKNIWRIIDWSVIDKRINGI